MSKLTITEFRKLYSTEEACLDKVFQLRYGKLEACPQCQCPASFRRITTRRCYQCTQCYSQFYPTAGTVFEKTRTPLTSWMFIIYLFITTRNGVAAKEIERQLGVTYKCAFRMGHKIRELIGGLSEEQLKGLVEADETFIGGKNKNRHQSKKKEGSQGGAGKAVVVGFVERGGEIKAQHVESVDSEVLKSAIQKSIQTGAIVLTDSNPSYNAIEGEYFHESVNHTAGEYVRGIVHTNAVENYWSQLKRTIYGTHMHVSDKYLQNYVNECTFRYNNREKGNQMFDTLIEKLPAVKE